MRFSDWRNRLFPSPPWDEVVYWALDLETTGLHPDTDHIISVGMVPIRGGVIRYGERFASFVRPPDNEGLSTEGLAAHHSCRRSSATRRRSRTCCRRSIDRCAKACCSSITRRSTSASCGMPTVGSGANAPAYGSSTRSTS